MAEDASMQAVEAFDPHQGWSIRTLVDRCLADLVARRCHIACMALLLPRLASEVELGR